ncbi:ATP-binding protein [Lebetimonas sp. JH369]|uniref:ATP-binding protein n=1 Tax=Lebetimonas sp. JH369 TaxID=990069 RepID=UPI000465E527|nr:AAA family ATPase [Lebetimonas sp. JH369]
MLERFRLFQRALLKNLNTTYKRYFYEELKKDEKLLAIMGARGVGKTTTLLQYLKESKIPINEKLYISADWIDAENLFEIAETFYKENGKLLIIDEIHKYPNFEKGLKKIYDILDLKVIVSGSSALSINHAKADLSRRMLIKEVKGMSFREFLEFKYELQIKKISLNELLQNHINIAYEILEKINKPSIIPDFKEYLEIGYYPFYFQNEDKVSYLLKLKETINVVLEVDIPAISNIKFTTIRKFKKLIEYVCISHPFKPNMQELLIKMDMPKTAYAEAYEYLELLQKAKIIRLIKSANKKDAILTKPEKIYLNNTNLHFCYCETQEIGTLREVFFASMLEDYEIYAPSKGDFVVNEYTFEIGGKNKTKKQIKNLEYAYIVVGDIEIGSGNKIPLWLFGFLY